MTEMTEYAPGTPSWIDLATPDMDATVSFYEGLFGWEIPVAENAEQTGGYRVATSGGKSVAGIMPLMQEGQPAVWSTYVNVEDADATAAKATEAGGTVIAPPMDVMELGRMAFFADPTGAAIGIWQPNQMRGAQLVNEPVSALERAQHARPGRGKGVLRGRLRLGRAGRRSGGWRATRSSSAPTAEQSEG